MKINKKSILYVAIPIILSAFVHCWNPSGFPDIFYDEGIYMMRAMHVLAGEGVQAGTFHDHPFFGQLFLAGSLSLIGYPNSLHFSSDADSIQMFYFVPRMLMGLLTVVDTFLIYKISEKRYSKNVALLASVLFAVMPITWFLRRILLDSILLPFLLTSILFAIYAKDSQKNKSLVIFSGIFLGISIFTKETMFVMIPLIAFLVYQSNKNRKLLALWFIPVILIPLIWPIQSLQDNQFQLWLKDILFQVHRQNHNFGQILENFFIFDPLLLVIGLSGIAYAIMKKDSVVLLWFVPYLVFLIFLGYVQYFYWIPVLPVLCIAGSKLIIDITTKIKKNIRISIPYVIIAFIAIFGFTMSLFLVTTNVTSQYDVAAYVIQTHGNDKNTTIVSTAVYSWIFQYIYHMSNVLPDYRNILFYPLPTSHVILIADPHIRENINDGKQIQDLYNNATLVKKFQNKLSDIDLGKYPFTNMFVTNEGNEIEVKERK
jgi:dolichyl-phosphate-mannose-protein mannosyltransferase